MIMADKNILIRFLTSGDSPDVGSFKAGDKTLLSGKTGLIFIERGIAEEVRPKRKAKTEEVKGHGRD